MNSLSHKRQPTAAVLLLSAFAGLAVFVPSLARAQDTADSAACTFLEIQASNDGKDIPVELRPLEKKLQQPPFSAWTKFELLAKHDKQLTLMKTDELRIASKAKLMVTYHEYTKGKKERFRLSLALYRADGKKALGTDVAVEAGDYLVISMAPKQGMSYFLAITCKK